MLQTKSRLKLLIGDNMYDNHPMIFNVIIFITWSIKLEQTMYYTHQKHPNLHNRLENITQYRDLKQWIDFF